MSDKIFRHATVQDPQSIADYFDAIRDGFAAGKLTFSDSKADMSVCPAGMINVEIEVKRKENRRKLTLKFSWREDDGCPAGEDSGLNIEVG
ncbi:MAG: amphi-Trp domain-containing protein [Desulfovibrionaceae bacterium]|jgi:amphi-Trp domain-containing protein|nr:amphi-Trp domain-containing protein [Desulfovibrionaceae bacterium]